ncbi:zinc finger, CCHC-type containing protein [Tanacetum coccineum]
MVDSRFVMEQYHELLRILGQFTQHGLNMDESISVSSIIDKLPPLWKDFKHGLKHIKDELSLVQLGSHFRIEETLRAEESGKGKGKEIIGSSSVNMIEDGKNKNNNKNNKAKKRKNDDCHFKKNNGGNTSSVGQGSRNPEFNLKVDAFAWWIDLGATCHACKDRYWFDTFYPVQDGSILHMGDESTKPILGRGNVARKIYYWDLTSTPIPEFVEDETLEQTRKRCKWENDDYICRGHILNSMSDAFLDVYQNVGSAKELWNQLESKYMTEDASSKKFLFTQHGLNMDESIFVSSIIDKLSSSWKDFKDILKHNKDELSLESYRRLRLRIHHNKMVCPKEKNRALKEMINSMLSYLGLSEGFWGEAMAVVRLLEPKREILSEKIIESRDAMFDEKRFTSIPRPKSLLSSSNEDQIGETPIEIPTTHRSNRDAKLWVANGSFKRKMKVDRAIDKFKARLVIQGFRQKEGINYFDIYSHIDRISIIRLLIALAATYNLVIHQMDVKTTFLNDDLEEEAPKQWHQRFDEVVLFSGFVLNQSDKCVYCKFDKSNNEVIICLYVDDMLIFETDHDQVDKTKEFLSSNFSIKDMGEADVILGIRIKHEDKGRAVDQLEYSRVIGCLMYAMTSTRLDIAYVVFFLGGGAISWASKKQTCITDSTMETEFVALAAAGKVAEWSRNLIYEIPLWPKPISPISIHCDIANHFG